MGCVFGARLAESGCETVLLDVQADVVQAIEDSGITVRRDGSDRQVPVRATADVASVGRSTSRSSSSRASTPSRRRSPFAPIVRGLDDRRHTPERSRERRDPRPGSSTPQQVVQGVTAESGTSLGPGVVDHPGSAATYVGPFEGGSLVDRAIRGAARAAGFDAQATPAIGTEIWKKLVVGASTLPAPALLGMACGPLMRQPQMRELVDDTAREVVAVAERSVTTSMRTSGSPTSTSFCWRSRTPRARWCRTSRRDAAPRST